jgi:hypothetical protein
VTQIIQNDDFEAVLKEPRGNHAPDISGASSDQHAICHVICALDLENEISNVQQENMVSRMLRNDEIPHGARTIYPSSPAVHRTLSAEIDERHCKSFRTRQPLYTGGSVVDHASERIKRLTINPQ